MDNIRDFIVLHYITKRRDTDFWKAVAEVEIPDSLANNLAMWRQRMPVADDFTSHTKKILFNEYNFALVMNGLELFDNKKIKMQYENLPQEVKDHTERLYQEKTEFDKIKAIPHKMMLDLLRRLV